MNAAGTQVSGSATLTVNPPGTTLTASPSSANYSVAANGHSSQTFTISNTTGYAATGLSIQVLSDGSGSGSFMLASGGTCARGGTLAGDSSCTVVVSFWGGCGSAGANSGTLTVTGTGVGNAAQADLYGSYGAGICR
jgi:hypothetical protein